MGRSKKQILDLDKHYKALKAGKRVSKKYATVQMPNGTKYRRRNANQYMPEGTTGGNVYYEHHRNRADKDHRSWYGAGGEAKGWFYTIGGF